MKKLLLPALATLALIGAGCNSSATTTNNAVTPTATANTNTKATSNTTNTTTTNVPVTPVNEVTTEVVAIKNFAFSPATLTVKAGTTVTWTNQDSATHDVKGDAFASEPLSQGETFSFTFDKAGNYDYICSFHPSMTGKVIVE